MERHSPKLQRLGESSITYITVLSCNKIGSLGFCEKRGRIEEQTNAIKERTSQTIDKFHTNIGGSIEEIMNVNTHGTHKVDTLNLSSVYEIG